MEQIVHFLLNYGNKSLLSSLICHHFFFYFSTFATLTVLYSFVEINNWYVAAKLIGTPYSLALHSCRLPISKMAPDTTMKPRNKQRRGNTTKMARDTSSILTNNKTNIDMSLCNAMEICRITEQNKVTNYFSNVKLKTKVKNRNCSQQNQISVILFILDP